MKSSASKTAVTVANQPGRDWAALVVFVTQGAKAAEGAAAAAAGGEAASRAAARLVHAGVAKGKAREVTFELIEEHGHIRRVYVVGLGALDKLIPETLRQASGAVAKILAKHEISRADVVLPNLAALAPEDAAEAVVSGLLLGTFDDRQYKGTAHKEGDDDKPRRLVVTLIAGSGHMKGVQTAAQAAQVVAEAQNFCRTIANQAGNQINPPALAAVARDMAKDAGLKCTIMDEKQLAKLKMGGILAVGAASIHTPPRLIVLEHKPAGVRAGKPLLVVGKAITFDSGGISIKPADKMGKMIYDKCGGIAVLGLMYAAARLKLPVHIVGILSSAENAISSLAYRPGDIITMYNGVTVEVTNTDAEGRLVLGDAIAWGIEKFAPAAVIDLATLTGGVIVALGRNIAGIMSNNDQLVGELLSAGEKAGEKMWRLPVGEEQREQIKSDLADIVNSAGREGHPLQGAAFLSYFLPGKGEIPWAHLDIAGVSDTEKELPYYSKGATGWGVRTLVNWVRGRGA